jgi:hypothetical protein
MNGRAILFADSNTEVYAYFKLHNNMVGTLDYVLFTNPDSGMNFVGKIHCIFLDKVTNEDMVEIQLFYDSKKIDNKMGIEFYQTQHYVEISTSLIQRKVVIKYVNNEYEIDDGNCDEKCDENDEMEDFIINDIENDKIIGFYQYELTGQDELLTAIEPNLYDNISSWLSTLQIEKCKWYEHEIFDELIQKYLSKLMEIKDFQKCQSTLLKVINGKSVNITNKKKIVKFVNSIKRIADSNIETTSVREVHNIFQSIMV